LYFLQKSDIINQILGVVKVSTGSLKVEKQVVSYALNNKLNINADRELAVA